MARTLIEQMAGEFDPTEHPNQYRKTLEKLLRPSAASSARRRRKPGPRRSAPRWPTSWVRWSAAAPPSRSRDAREKRRAA